MTKKEEELLSELEKGMAVFHHIPEDIGEIIYCNTTNNKSEPDDEYLTKNKIAFSVIIPLLIAGICWYIWYEHYIICIIVTLICAFFSYLCIDLCLDFSGTDYFVGKEGATIVKFKKNRDNCEVGTIYFRDVEDILTGEHIVMVKKKTTSYQKKTSPIVAMVIDKAYDSLKIMEYKHTEYFYALYGHENDGQVNAIESTSGKFDKNYSESFLDDEHRFWKMICKSWYDYKIPQLLSAFENGKAIGFNVYKGDKYYHNFIMLKGIELSIHGKVFNIRNTEGISFDKGQFKIKSKDNNSDNSENGSATTESIPIHCIANRDTFIYIIKEYFSFFHNLKDETDNSTQHYYVQIPEIIDCTFNIGDWEPAFPRKNSGEIYDPVWSTPNEIKEMEKDIEDEMKDYKNRNYGLSYLPWEDDPRGPLL